MARACEARFVAADAAMWRLVPLDAVSAVYHRASGITHIVASPAPELLAALAAPATRAELLARLERDYDLGDPTSLDARLAELESAGLVLRA